MSAEQFHKRGSDPMFHSVEIKIERALNAMEQLRADLHEAQERHEILCKADIGRLEKLIAPMKEAYEVVDKPARWLGRIMVLLATGGLLWMGERAALWFTKHFQG